MKDSMWTTKYHDGEIGMSKFEMYLSPRELEVINQVVRENNIAESFRLTYDNSSGIGSTIDLIFETKLNGRDVSVVVPISTEEDW